MNTITLVLPDNRQTRAFIKMATAYLKQTKVTKKQAIKVALKAKTPVVEPFYKPVEPKVNHVIIDEEKEVEKIMTLPAHVQPLALANLARRLPKAPTPEVDTSNRKPITIGRRDINRSNMFTRTPAPVEEPPSEPEDERNVAIKELADEVQDLVELHEMEHAMKMVELHEMELEHARDMAEREQLRQQGVFKEYTIDVNHSPEVLEQEAQKDREWLERCNMGEEDKRSARVETYQKEKEQEAAKEAARNVVDPKQITKWLARVPIKDKSMSFEVNTVPQRIKHLFNKDKVERNGSTYRLEVYINGVECESNMKGYVGAINASCGGRGVKSVKLTWRAI